MKKGAFFAMSAYVLWGLFPIYWKLLDQVQALQLLAHRILWSFVFLVIVQFVTKQWAEFRRQAFKLKIFGTFVVLAFLIAINWLTYVWAVNSDFIVETSLGYFINPLLSVLMGVIFFREKLRSSQWLAILLAFLGVVYLSISYSRLPWIALILAFSFGIYGLLKKTIPISSLNGMTLETGILFPLALGYLVYSEVMDQGSFLHTNIISNVMLVFAGPVTAIPLLFFASATRRIPLSWIGVLQYIAPTLQFLVGVLIYREPIDQSRVVGFVMVWIAVAIFLADGIVFQKSREHQMENA